MLFLYRPRETYMPFARPMAPSNQAAYNRTLQAKFQASRRVAPAPPAKAIEQRDPALMLEQVERLHESGALTDEELALLKDKVFK